MKKNKFLLLMAYHVLLANLLFAAGDKFQFCIIKHSGFYNPHPTSYENVIKFLTSTTSIDPLSETAQVLPEPALFRYPFLYLTAKGALPDFTKREIEFFSRHLNSGGLLLIDEAENFGLEDFRSSVKELVKQIFPDRELEKIPQEDVIFKSFYLKPKVSGRVALSPYLYGVKKDGRWLIIYSKMLSVGFFTGQIREESRSVWKQ